MADSSLPQFWDVRYHDRTTPWDAGGVPDALQRDVEQWPSGARILIPGCGSAYEVAFLAQRGFDVRGIDFSDEAVKRAREVAGSYADRIAQADFFAFDHAGRRFQVIYERAFLCALPRPTWHGYGPRCAEILEARGIIAGFFFFHDNRQGPPFGTSQSELDALLSPWFDRIADDPVADSLPVFAGRERWQVWRKRT